MAAAYFVCGMQLMFITTHLPSYLAICGMDPMLSAQALGVDRRLSTCSAACSSAGPAGAGTSSALLGGIYVARSIVLAWYFMLPPTPLTTLVFAALMGFLWLGVGPLVAGARRRDVRPALAGHDPGRRLHEPPARQLRRRLRRRPDLRRLGSYDLAWRLAVAIGLVAGIVQVTFALLRPVRPAPA